MSGQAIEQPHQEVRIIDVMREKVAHLRDAADAIEELLDQVEYYDAHQTLLKPEVPKYGFELEPSNGVVQCDRAQCGPCGCEVKHAE